jgi:bifunctional NMN adenylyltransferase/nudix hydrolase
MAHDYNIAVFIGRFQPFHNGHLSVILEGLERADHLVVLVGSAGSPRCHRNPFTFDERSRMIRESIPAHLRNRVRIKPLEDAAYNDSRWIHRVQSNVTRAAWEFGYTNEPNTALIGHSKDHSSYYLKLFPQWGSIDVPNCKNINSTRIRNAYFSNIVEMWLSDSDGHKIGDLPRVTSSPQRCGFSS